jgi:hypothetical protein
MCDVMGTHDAYKRDPLAGGSLVSPVAIRSCAARDFWATASTPFLVFPTSLARTSLTPLILSKVIFETGFREWEDGTQRA